MLSLAPPEYVVILHSLRCHYSEYSDGEFVIMPTFQFQWSFTNLYKDFNIINDCMS